MKVIFEFWIQVFIENINVGFFLFFFILIFSNRHPFFLSLILVGFRFFSALLLWSRGMFWVFLSLILVFLGGVIAIILYVSSLINNEKSINSLPNSLFCFFLVVLIFTWLRENVAQPRRINSLYIITRTKVIITLTLFLFLRLLRVVKVSSNYLGALKN